MWFDFGFSFCISITGQRGIFLKGCDQNVDLLLLFLHEGWNALLAAALNIEDEDTLRNEFRVGFVVGSIFVLH